MQAGETIPDTLTNFKLNKMDDTRGLELKSALVRKLLQQAEEKEIEKL